jgi:hypothetical protein
VLEQLALPDGVFVSGLESDGGDLFYCGGGSSGKVRAVRAPGAWSAGMSETWSGGCACGAIRYAIAGEPMLMNDCQCRDCQRKSGTGHGPT